MNTVHMIMTVVLIGAILYQILGLGIDCKEAYSIVKQERDDGKNS